METELLKQIAFELVTITVSIFASVFIPGIGGIIVGGAIQAIGDALGLEFRGGKLTAAWAVQELLMIFLPFAAKFKSLKIESALLRQIENGVLKVDKAVEKIDNALIDFIETMKTKWFYKSSGGKLPAKIEEEFQQVEAQEAARTKLGDKIENFKKVTSIMPNANNPDSWIASVQFIEKVRLGPRQLHGDLIITYYVNNAARIGWAKKPIRKIVLGRTSGGERKESNQDRYRKVATPIDKTKVSLRKVVFRNASYYSDYLPWGRVYSWGGYYMRKWMIGVPGRKGAVNSLILFGSINRVFNKLKGLTGDLKELFHDPTAAIAKYAKKNIGKTRFGSKANKVKAAFSKEQQARKDILGFGTRESWQKIKSKTRSEKIKKLKGK